MFRVKSKLKDGRLVVRVKLSHNDAINSNELVFISSNQIRGFLRAGRTKYNEIEYIGPYAIPLSTRFKMPVSQYEFFLIMAQIVDATQKLQRFKLSPGKVLWDINNVYINEATNELQFVYVPIEPSQINSNILFFIESIIYAVSQSANQYPNYLAQFRSFLVSLPRYDAEKIEQYIANVDRRVVKMIKRRTAGSGEFMTGDQWGNKSTFGDQRGYGSNIGSQREGYPNVGEQGVHDPYSVGQISYGNDERPTDILVEDERPTDILNEDESTGLLGSEEEATALFDDEGETVLLTDEGETDLLDENRARNAMLSRLSTGESVVINKPVFRIGRERNSVDYYVSKNKAVGRSHADIITRGKRFFVIDLNSKNSTYINDQVLPAQQEVEIFDNDRLKLADEEFTFHVY